MTEISIPNFFNIAQSFSSVSDLDLLFKKISTAAEELTQCETSCVMLLDENKEYLYFKTVGGEKERVLKTIKIKVGEGVAGWVAQNNQALIVDDVTKDSRFSSFPADEKSGFKTQSILCVPLLVGNEMIGVMEVLNKKASASKEKKFTNSDLSILTSLASFAAVSISNSKLNLDQKNFFANVLEILTAAVETGVRNPLGHCRRVAEISCAIARRLGIEKEEYKRIYYASLLHDIGYITAPRRLTGKEGSLLDDRQDKIEKIHPVIGAELAGSINLFKQTAPLIRAHHELWNGSGYPDKLSEKSIPLGARIISLAESIEDLRNPLISDIEFKKYISEYVVNNSGKLYDPQVVQALLEEIESRKEALI